MSFLEKIATFCKNNVVILTSVPLIIAVHWAWLKIQDVPYLVPPSEKRDLPVLTVTSNYGNCVIV